MRYTLDMIDLMKYRAEAYSIETFRCGNCNREFEAKIITWVDVSRTPQAKQSILKRDFNIVQCTHCGNRHFSGTPFFYEDFEDGLLLAVYPRIPDQRGETERVIRDKYGYYPLLEFFYDMTQLWMLIFFQEHYKTSKDRRVLSLVGAGENRLRKILFFLKENPLMLEIREQLTGSQPGGEPNDELADMLGQATSTLEEMLPWPLDRRCRCGADLSERIECCGNRISLDGHDRLLSQHYMIYCPACNGALSGASCGICGKVYTWQLGIVDSYRETHIAARTAGSGPAPLAAMEAGAGTEQSKRR